MESTKQIQNIVIIGSAGSGKSTLTNILTRGNEAKVDDDPGGVTKDINFYQGQLESISIEVTDIPGFGDLDVSSQDLVKKWNQKMENKNIHLLIICFNSTEKRYNSFLNECIQIVQKAIKQEDFSNCVALCFTKSDLIQDQIVLDNYIIKHLQEVNKRLGSNIQHKFKSSDKDPENIRNQVYQVLLQQIPSKIQVIDEKDVQIQIQNLIKKNDRCFSLDSVVWQDVQGNMKLMKNLLVGDKVLSVNSRGQVVSDIVLAIIHHQESELSPFIRLQFSNASFITLTSNHLICSKLNQYLLAGELEVGDSIVRFDSQTKQLFNDKIISINTLTLQGFKTPLTKNGNLIVDGCVSSCYANTTQSYGQFFSWPCKHIAFIRKMGQDKNSLHKYFSFLLSVSKYFPLNTVKECQKKM